MRGGRARAGILVRAGGWGVNQRQVRTVAMDAPAGAAAGAAGDVAAADAVVLVPEELEGPPEQPNAPEEDAWEGVGDAEGGGEAAAAGAAGVGGVIPAIIPSKELVWAQEQLQQVVLPFTAVAGPLLRARRGGVWTPMAVWCEFVPRGILALIVRETNRYAEQLRVMPKPTFARADHPWPPRFLDAWKDLSVRELKAFLGLSYAFGLIKAPRLRDYWSTTKMFFNFPLLSRVMSRDRFFVIKRCLHFVDNVDAGVDHEDPFYKVRPLLASLHERSRELYQPGMNLAIDEQMQTCNNRTCGQVFRPPRKKTNGIKIWSICESGTGYLCTFRVAFKRGSKISDVVLAMVRDLRAKHHRIHMDNLFSKPPLFQRLLYASQYGCGTWRANFGMPLHLKPAQNKDLGKGELRWSMAPPGLLGVVWHDSKTCNFLSNFHGPNIDVVHRRRAGQPGRIEVPAPAVAVDYNKYMGAVDEVDSLRASYTTAKPSTRWYLALFYWWLDMAAIQSMVVYRALGTLITHAQFVHELGVALIEAGAGADMVRVPNIRKRRNAGAPPSPRKRYRNTHWPAWGDRYRRCHWCYNGHNKREKKTRMRCTGCQRYLCRDCFKPYHDQHKRRK